MKIKNIEIELLVHAAVRIRNAKHTIYIDPYSLPDGCEEVKADLLLITHEHQDHCSLKDIEKIITPNTTVITVADCLSKLSGLKIKQLILTEPGKSFLYDTIKINSVPAYNIGKQFHPQANGWVGFVLELDGEKIYHSGDTDLISEMKLIDVDVAFLPVGGTYTMTAREAASAVATFKRCELAIPMHYGTVIGSRKDADEFKSLAKCKVEILI